MFKLQNIPYLNDINSKNNLRKSTERVEVRKTVILPQWAAKNVNISLKSFRKYNEKVRQKSRQCTYEKGYTGCSEKVFNI